MCRNSETCKARKEKKTKMVLEFNSCCSHHRKCCISMVLPSKRRRFIFDRPGPSSVGYL
ncbi:hypothetical protein Hanom_Chr14g01298041 [Helianthus anomalus]